MVQRSFLRKISGISHLSYWEQLNYLNLYSLERRRERYRLIYVWRILEGHVPNIMSSSRNCPKITSKWHQRRGRECIIPPVKCSSPMAVRRLLYASLPIHGQQLFNVLPIELRNMTGCSVDTFKRKLDKFLQTVPDQPLIPGYTAQRRAESNSLLHMTRFAAAHPKPQVEVPGGSSTPGNRGVTTVLP